MNREITLALISSLIVGTIFVAMSCAPAPGASANDGRIPESSYSVSHFYDEERGVHCWTNAPTGISCIPESQLTNK